MKLCNACGLNPAQEGRNKCRPCRYNKNEKKAALPRIKNQVVGQRILLIDIETSPNVSEHWDLFNQNIGINQVLIPKAVLCVAAKWYGDDQSEVIFVSRWDDGQRAMIEKIWQLLNEADIVIHYYGQRFDVPHLNTEFLLHGLMPPRPFKQIDLKLAVSKRFNFTSNKLQFISQAIGLSGKVDHEGHGLWAKTINLFGQFPEAVQLDARARMQEYNEQDTVLLEEVYEVLLPWIPNHPHGHLYLGAGCPKCGQEDEEMVRDGFAYTSLSKFYQYRCPVCGDHFRGGKRIDGVDLRESMR